MEERDKCKSHPQEQIRLICKEKGCPKALQTRNCRH